MSEDLAHADTDNAGIWRDPSGIVAIGGDENRYSMDHGITLICDSHRKPLRRLTVRFGDRKRQRARMPCPECGRTVTVYVRR